MLYGTLILASSLEIARNSAILATGRHQMRGGLSDGLLRRHYGGRPHTPIDLLATERLEAYLARRGGYTGVGGGQKRSTHLVCPWGSKTLTLERWRCELTSPNAGSSRACSRELIPTALLPHWVARPFGAVSFRLTQILTKHGCFDVFLCRINRVSSPLYTFARCQEGE